MEGGANDDVAEVIAAGDSRSDDRETERRALVGTGQVDLGGEEEGMAAGPHSRRSLRRQGSTRDNWDRPARQALHDFPERRQRAPLSGQ